MNTNTKLLDKVRGLLAKGESTDNEHEAEAFLAKAHELIRLHALKEHELRGNASGDIITRTVWLPEPYSMAKAHIAWAITKHTGTYAVVSSRIGAKYGTTPGSGRDLTVTGTAEAIDRFEAVLTGLLATAATGMLRITKAYIAANPDLFPERFHKGTWSYRPVSTRTARDEYLVGFAAGVAENLRRSDEDADADGKSGALVLLSDSKLAEAHYKADNRVGSGRAKYGSAAGRADGRRADVGRSRVASRRALGTGR